MNLTDLFAAGATILPQIALMIFVAVFVAVVVWTIRRPNVEVQHQARLPLGDAEDGSQTEVSR